MQYVQRREVKKERALGTWHLSSTCWEPRLCKDPLCQVRHCCGNFKRRGEEVGVAREQFSFLFVFFFVFFFFAGEAVISSSSSLFLSFGGEGFKSGV